MPRWIGDELVRKLILTCLVAALAACGQSSQPSDTAPADTAPAEQLPPWRVELTENPAVIRPYSPVRGLAPLPDGTVSDAGADVAQISTPAPVGAWAAMLITGPDGDQSGTALRIHVQVESGALILASTYAGADPNSITVSETVEAGSEAIVYLPLDRTGNPALIVANGSSSGASLGSISKIDLVGPPPTATD